MGNLNWISFLESLFYPIAGGKWPGIDSYWSVAVINLQFCWDESGFTFLAGRPSNPVHAEVLANGTCKKKWNLLLPIGVFTQHGWQNQRIRIANLRANVASASCVNWSFTPGVTTTRQPVGSFFSAVLKLKCQFALVIKLLRSVLLWSISCGKFFIHLSKPTSCEGRQGIRQEMFRSLSLFNVEGEIPMW